MNEFMAEHSSPAAIMAAHRRAFWRGFREGICYAYAGAAIAVLLWGVLHG